MKPFYKIPSSRPYIRVRTAFSIQFRSWQTRRKRYTTAHSFKPCVSAAGSVHACNRSATLNSPSPVSLLYID